MVPYEHFEIQVDPSTLVNPFAKHLAMDRLQETDFACIEKFAIEGRVYTSGKPVVDRQAY